MTLSLEQVVKQLNDSVIIAPGKLEEFVPPKAHPKTAEELVAELVKADHLTKFQAQHVAAGKTKSLILGNYTVLDKIGAGGMGQVFKAEHRRMKRVVAIKMLPPAVTKDAAAAARFQREVEAAAKLSHSNIVAAYDADEANGAHFLVMEYVEGKDLSALVKKDGPFPVAQALDCILQAAKGLEFAHSEGVVHRDIKPANLLLDKKGAVKILDMGLARMRDPLADPSAAPGADLTHSGSIMGTIDYMAPEQAMDSHQADARSDIYSLGCTFHYLLTGRPPYGGDSVLKRLTAHQQAAIPLLSSTQPDIPPGFDAVFGRMMAKRPAARFQTMKELIPALESLRNQPASARPLPLAAVPLTPSPSGMNDLESVMLPGVEPGSRKVHKSSSKVPLFAAVVVLLLAAAGAGAWMVSGHKSDETAQIATARTTEVQQPEADRQPATVEESKSTAAPPKEPTPAATPKSAAPPPEVMPPKVEPPVNAAPQSAPLIATPVVPDASATKTASARPPVARPAMTVALAPMPAEQPAAADGKLSIPAAEGQREALKLVKELYKDDYAQAKQPEAKAALAEKLLNESQQTKDDATALYVVLHEARDLAVEAADPALAERAIGMLAGRYAIEPLPELTAALEEMTGKPHPAGANRAITEAALGRVEEAQVTNDFELTKRLADVALTAARKSRDSSLSKRAIEVGKSVNAAKQQWDGLYKAQATLAQTPDDPAANLAVGRYLCFVQGDWEQGLSHLAKGTDGPLKDLATKGLKPPTDAAALAELGDTWFGAAEKAKGKDKADFRAGAAYWYTQAEPGLTGLVKTIVEKRLKELGGPVAVSQPTSAGKLPETMELALAPGVSMKFRFIPAGTFMMGTPGNAGNEFPHRVNITRPLYFAVTEVTQVQWLAIMGNNSSRFQSEPSRPVENVSWNDCQQFLERLNQNPAARKFRFRLPTDAEWEYACRAGTTSIYFFGDDPNLLPQYGWFKGNSNGTTHPVGQLKPNAWGLFDMHGNVWEWCSDWHAPDYYKNSPENDPQGPSVGTRRIMRGGSWVDLPQACRSAERNRVAPEVNGSPDGLRIVCEPRMDPRQSVSVSSDRWPAASANFDGRRETGGAGEPNKPWNAAAFQKWMKDVAALPSETQGDAVAKKLQEFNPGFDGKVTGFKRNSLPRIVDGVVTGFGFVTENVTDISPVRALMGLKSLNCYATNGGTSKLFDLSPLQGMALNILGCGGTKVADLSPLRGMPLAELYCGMTQVSDLSPLKGIQLTNLECSHTSVSDLSPLRGMPLKTLWLGVTQVADLSPLTGMRLTVLACDSTKVSDLSPLRGMPLKTLLVMNTGVSDLSPLEDCKSLESLNIKSTKVTPAGVVALQKALPNCKIDWNDPAKPAASDSN